MLVTPEGWGRSIRTVEGGMVCGRLSTELLDPEVALAAAAANLKELARVFHDTTVEVVWDPARNRGLGPGKSFPLLTTRSSRLTAEVRRPADSSLHVRGEGVARVRLPNRVGACLMGRV
ncbi:hypothetical protein AB0F25_29035 [Streptomyces wedmorensis]|uniref:hypothetical protein n=1 Tax=Streptomyces wedmorensis TaxID=43759 RepID=UPI00342C623C